MSTTPMYRPFLVGQHSAREIHAGAHPNPPDDTMCGIADHETVYRGLHLVPATGNNRTKPSGPFRNHYKIAAAAAALFLVLTIV